MKHYILKTILFFIGSIFVFAQNSFTLQLLGMEIIILRIMTSISSGDVVNWVSEGGYHDVNFNINSITNETFGNPSEIANLASCSS